MTADFTSTNHGTIVTLAAISPAALDWCDENLCGEELSAQSATINVEPRCFFDIACGILADGLSLQDTATGAFAKMEG